MAATGSIQDAETSCQRCTEKCQIKGRCIQCNLFMCANCCFLHRIEGLNLHGQHDIVDIEVNNRALDHNFDNVYCDTHGQRCFGFCNTCEDIVCHACVDHIEHSISDLSVGQQLSIFKLKSRSSLYEADIIKLFRHLSHLQSIRTAEMSKYETEKQKILSRDTYLKEAVEVHTRSLLQQLDQKWVQLEKSIHDEENLTKSSGRELEEGNSNLIRILESKNSKALFIAAKKEAKFPNSKRIKTEFDSLPVFLHGNASQLSIESIHGIMFAKCKDSSIKFEFKLTENYTTKFSSVDNIVCCLDGSILFSCKEQLQHLKLFNGLELKNDNFLVKCKNMALLPSGDLLASTGTSDLQILSTANKTIEKSKYSVEPLKTTAALHITNDGRIIVGATDGYEYSQGNKRIIIMDLFGKQLKIYNINKQCTDTIPYKITSDKNNNIYIIHKNGTQGSVFVIGSGGNITGTYNGFRTKSGDDISCFTPDDLAVTISDHVLVCDSKNHLIHMINSVGKCIMYEDTRSLGIQQTPCSINVDARGVLVIGCRSRKKDVKDAKLYFVQISEF